MELAIKILIYAGGWYLAGVLGMLYIRHWYNMGLPEVHPDYDRISGREVLTLALIGVGVILFIMVAEIHYRLTGKG